MTDDNTDVDSGSESDPSDDGEERMSKYYLVNSFLGLVNILHYLRCSCGNCVVMPSQRECICCREVVPVLNKLSEAKDEDIKCITDHPGFSAVCLNVLVLQAAYSEYRQQYGNYNATINESVNKNLPLFRATLSAGGTGTLLIVSLWDGAGGG